ncbi:MAG: hypothetical protein MH825_11950 [Cyanobacteria bacterium]|nr:hypothetical protein [Cyanobacteriota bacterium]
MTDPQFHGPQSGDRDLQARLRALEAEIEQDSPRPTPPINPDSAAPVTNWSAELNILVRQVGNWFSSLPTVGKAIAAIAALFIGLSLLRIAVSIVAAIFSATFLGILIYVAYRVWLAPNLKQKS